MLQKEVSLFKTKTEFLLFLAISIFILLFSLLIEFNNYKQLTQFDSNLVSATVIKQYSKSKESSTGKIKTYQVLKFKSDKGYLFYSTASKKLQDLRGKKIELEIWAGKISFYEYLTTSFAYHKIIHIKKESSIKQKLNLHLDNTHINPDIASIYKALYSATPLPKKLQLTFSTLGVSHLLAISGFHLGVLSGVLFFMFKYPYSFFQNRYFPYRNAKKDLFIAVAFVLLIYLLFLDSPPSLLRAFFMLLIGFFLYDRGFKIISMQTLLLTVIILLVIFPKLIFALGFWLSVAGVFYIFVFLLYFKEMKKSHQFIVVPFWVYLFMLPYSLAIFGNFSFYHPLSIIWTSLFTLFYPLSIITHLIGYGSIFDNTLENFLTLVRSTNTINLDIKLLYIYVLFSFMSIYKKSFLWLTFSFAMMILTYSLYKIF